MVLSRHGAKVAMALGTTDRACCDCYPDPHIRTWDDNYYDYHGEADLILCQGQVIDVHIKTETRGGWSAIIAAAVHMHATDDTLEVRVNGTGNCCDRTTGATGDCCQKLRRLSVPAGTEYFVNGVQPASPPSNIGGYGFSISNTDYELDMGGSQFIQIFGSYGNSLRVLMNLHGSVGYTCQGMCGNWEKGGLRDRDGNSFPGTRRLANAPEVGEEWSVQGSDPRYFLISHQGAPTYDEGKLNEDLRAAATEACKKGEATANTAILEQCVNDVLLTNDLKWAYQPQYKEPEFQPDDTETECPRTPPLCRLMRGTCKWRCDPRQERCIRRLCRRQGDNDNKVPNPGGSYVEGCSCAMKRGLF